MAETCSPLHFLGIVPSKERKNIFRKSQMIYPLDLLKPNTKTQNIVCCVNENLTTLLYTLTGGTKNRRRKKNQEYKKVEC